MLVTMAMEIVIVEKVERSNIVRIKTEIIKNVGASNVGASNIGALDPDILSSFNLISTIARL